MKLSLLSSLFLVCAYIAPAQTQATLTTVGYASPPPIPVAPGQVVTLFFREVAPFRDGALRSADAKTVPLPTVLGGLSVQIGRPPASFPIFAVRQENDCIDNQSNPACLLTSLRVQVPFNIKLTNELVLLVDGEASRSFRTDRISDNAHVLTSCDLTWDTRPLSICSRLSFHADGTVISDKSPARSGESIVVYLWGLGETTPSMPSGEVSPPGVAVTQVPGTSTMRVRLLDSPRTNPAAIPAFYSAADWTEPGLPIEFVGLTPGQIGLYQMNITIPKSFTAMTSCGDPVPAEPGTTIAANAVLRITTIFAGTQEVGFCWRA